MRTKVYKGQDGWYWSSPSQVGEHGPFSTEAEAQDAAGAARIVAREEARTITIPKNDGEHLKLAAKIDETAAEVQLDLNATGVYIIAVYKDASGKDGYAGNGMSGLIGTDIPRMLRKFADMHEAKEKLPKLRDH